MRVQKKCFSSNVLHSPVSSSSESRSWLVPCVSEEVRVNLKIWKPSYDSSKLAVGWELAGDQREKAAGFI